MIFQITMTKKVRFFFKKLLVMSLLSLLSSMASADEVTIKLNDLTLNANLELAESKKLSDGVVLIMHSF